MTCVIVDTRHGGGDYLDTLHRMDTLDEVWFIIAGGNGGNTLPLSIPAHCKRARTFSIEDEDVSAFVHGLLAMHRSSRPSNIVALATAWTDISQVYCIAPHPIRGAITLTNVGNNNGNDDDPLEVSDFSSSSSSSDIEE